MRIIFILFLFSLRSLGQPTEKPGYVLDENGKNISQDFFLQQSKTGKYSWATYETKDSLNVRLVLREVYGEINPKQKKELLENLKIITGTTVHNDHTIIINFAFKETSPYQTRHCLDHYSSVKSYRNFFKNKEQFAQFYISQQGFKYPKEFVFEDSNDAIRKMFFPYGLDCNYIIVKPDGRFYRQMSEHHQDKIPSKAKEDW
jgi:hypothetical protein